MVVHEHVGVEHDARHLQVVRQLAEEPLTVVVSPEDLRSAVAAAGNMIDGIRKIDPWWARHVARIPSSTPNCKPYSTKRKPDPVRRPVVHEHVGVEHDARHLQVLRQLAEEPLTVVVSPEDLRSAVAAARNMIDGIRKIDPWWARHVARIPSSTPNCKPYSTKRKPDPVRPGSVKKIKDSRPPFRSDVCLPRHEFVAF